MKTISATTLALMIAAASANEQPTEQRVKIAETPGHFRPANPKKSRKTGKGKPAKGFDPETGTWTK